ncbi:MAG: sigma-70 family RNA polymerase sigma factor [Phycisphaerales bacterium]|nr:sigma-70 family RNA polymerase sigma factor [Phycisphaerales bacterium]
MNDHDHNNQSVADGQVTLALRAVSGGDANAAANLLPLVYEQLRRLARAKMGRLPPGVTVQPTALVHEAYMRVLAGRKEDFNDRNHFFATAARAMRDILVEQARRRASLKRGGDRAREALDDIAERTPAIHAPDEAEGAADDMLALDRALHKFEQADARKAEVVMLRFFAGLTHEQIAESLGLSVPTVERDVRFARAWLAREVGAAKQTQG